MMIQSDSVSRFCVLALLMLGPVPAVANDQDCAAIGALAYEVMAARQNDKEMSLVMAAVSESSAGRPAIQKLFRNMVIAAYRKPSWRTQENKTQAITEFRNDYEAACYLEFAK